MGIGVTSRSGKSGSWVGTGDSKRGSSKGVGVKAIGPTVRIGIAVSKGRVLGSGESKGSKLGSTAKAAAAAVEVEKASTAAEHNKENRKETMLSQ